MSAAHTPKLTDKEMARELFVAGYHQAIDDLALELSMRVGADFGIVERLRAKASTVLARAAIAKATGEQA